jgi:3',5'-cyclic AMP phosphodiesterase CpdA
VAAAACLLCSAGAGAETFALVSDMNGRYGSTFYNERVRDAVAVIARTPPDAVLSTGDMIAGQKQPKFDAEWLDSMWRAFDETVSGPLAQAGIPLLPTPGNHDGSGLPAFALERERYARFWSGMESEITVLPGSEWPRRYAARLGGALVLGFDGTRPGPLPPEELAFVERMLAAHASEAACTLVMGHLPMWPLAQGREREIIADRALLDTLHAHGVDAYLSGHHHVYYPGVDDAGMLHLAVGALGGNARAFSGERLRQPHSIALLECGDGVLETLALEAPDFERRVPDARLPETVSGPLGILRRLGGELPLRP